MVVEVWPWIYLSRCATILSYVSRFSFAHRSYLSLRVPHPASREVLLAATEVGCLVGFAFIKLVCNNLFLS